LGADRRILGALALVLIASAAHAESKRIWRPGEEAVEEETPSLGPEHVRTTKLRDHRYSERFAVERVAVAADGSEIVALTRASREGPKSWDLGSGRSLKLPPMSRDAATIAWAPGKDLVAVSIRADVLSGERAGVELIRMSDGSSAGFLGGGDTASALAFSPDGARLAAATGEGVLVWSLPRGKAELALPLGSGADTVSWVSPSEFMVSAEGGARLMRASTDGEVLESWNGKRSDGPVAFSPTGQLVAVGDVNFFKILDLWDGGGAQKVPLEGTVNSLGWSMNGSVLAAGTDEGLVHVFAAEGARGIEFSTAPAVNGGSRPVRDERDDRDDRVARDARSERDDRDDRRDDGMLTLGSSLGGRGEDGGSSSAGGGGNPFASADVDVDIGVLVLQQMGGDPRSGATVEAAVQKNIKRLEPCWKRQARNGKLGSGKLVLEFGVTPNGEGVAIEAPLQDEPGNAKLVECLNERLREPLFGSGLGSLQIELTLDLTVR